ncbi:hypothetical protein OESDEN_03975 [Oesophagostomum dentatum]|uniref:Amiloride-sensitive sodium channel n=1 Tax=Oesophagostomum dentatum TaxID=61180 RepID=A0A0B1TKY6_OESDE|nr:hypothetical protein OESDEN_03975 [Oesophagostomum dentatum]
MVLQIPSLTIEGEAPETKSPPSAESRVSFFLPDDHPTDPSSPTSLAPPQEHQLVSFIIQENGIEFPMITLCNFNPIKKSYIKQLNKTGDLSDELLDYLMESLIDANTLYGTADRQNLHVGQKALEVYQNAHPNFTVQEFFMNAGFKCEDTMMLCSFGGRQFNCCQFSTAILTNLGKCYTLDMQASGKDWMQKQMEAGVTAGLQLILDAHLEEQFDGTGGRISDKGLNGPTAKDSVSVLGGMY